MDYRFQTLLQALDWWVIAAYLVGLILLSLFLSRSQHSRNDYYVGGRDVGPWPIAISTMATQCSTNSILGAPAFVAFSAGGGLLWMQYELAVPLAMLAIMLFLLPVFRGLQLVSVYEYLERRFNLATRLTLSGLFQFIRAFATAVTIYSIALVVELITGLSFFWSVMLLGVITLIYDVFGGVRAVIYSDVLQMIILVSVLILLLFLLIKDNAGLQAMMQTFPQERLQTLEFRHHGLGDGQTFAFWPMLIGGFFLYVSYYGCDQSQVQRELCARTIDESRFALLLNGLLRFPLVLLYCMVGVGIGAYAITHPDFIGQLPLDNGEPNFNLVVPLYILESLPSGLIGLSLVALFAAAMSSLDSVINSLSASTMEDFIRRFRRNPWNDRTELMISRLVTLFWGSISVTFAFYVGDIAQSVLVAINKIGSLINGPVLGVFALGLLTLRANATGAISGLIAGFLLNLGCWLFLPSVSWLWWNCFGFVLCVVAGYGISLWRAAATNNKQEKPVVDASEMLLYSRDSNVHWQRWRWKYVLLIIWFFILIISLLVLES